MSGSIFSKIIRGEIPAYRIAENKDYLAFLDVSPLAEGHTLVIPKQETDYIFDLDDEYLAGLFIFSKKVGLALGQSVTCKRIGIAVIGLEVPHAHIHLVPLNHVNDINFSRPRLKFSDGEFQAIASKIKKNIREPF